LVCRGEFLTLLPVTGSSAGWSYLQKNISLYPYTKKLKRHKSLGIDQIPAEFIKAEGRKISCEVHKHISSIWHKEESLEEWKDSISVLIYEKGDKTECSDYRGISLLSSTYKIFSNILLSSLTPYAEENIGQHQGWLSTQQFQYLRKHGDAVK
jgi:hypothetical protein